MPRACPEKRGRHSRAISEEKSQGMVIDLTLGSAWLWGLRQRKAICICKLSNLVPRWMWVQLLKGVTTVELDFGGWESLLFICSVMPSSLQPHGLQHPRLPCPLLSPRICSNSCPLRWWSHPTLSSSVALFSYCLQSFPASESFPVSWLFTWARNLYSIIPLLIRLCWALGAAWGIFDLPCDMQDL